LLAGSIKRNGSKHSGVLRIITLDKRDDKRGMRGAIKHARQSPDRSRKVVILNNTMENEGSHDYGLNYRLRQEKADRRANLAVAIGLGVMAAAILARLAGLF